MNEKINTINSENKEESIQEKIIKNLARALLGGLAITIAAESVALGKRKK